jgi:hypothetical protein
MRPAVVALIVVLLPAVGARPASAQRIDNLRITVTTSIGRGDGGERWSTRFDVEARKIGESRTFAFSRLPGQCGSGVRPGPAQERGEAFDGSMQAVYAAWTVQVTPIKQVGDAVTFRMQWTRSRDNGKASSVGEDSELTLRPGQSLTADVMSQALDTTESRTPPGCLVKTMALNVAVDYELAPERDRRLVAVDLWLIERLADGKERSQQLALRGLYHQTIPFYFDTLKDGDKGLDVFGSLQISPGEQTSEVAITTRSRVINPTPVPLFPPGTAPANVKEPEAKGQEAFFGRWVDSTTAKLQLALGEVVSVPLAPIRNPRVDPSGFNARALSYRIRVREIR